MSGPSFAITYKELQVIIASDRGYSRNIDDWNESQTYVINDVLTSGIARVYSPPPVNDEKISPDWTFLKPESQLAIAEGSTELTMPADFGSFSGPLSCQTSATSSNPWEIEWLNLGKIQRLYQLNPTVTGPPKYACEVVFRNIEPQSQGQRKGLKFYPTADMDYVINCVYTISPDKLTGANPMPYGGPQYRELYIASCLAVAELRFDNIIDGPKQMDFNRMLLAAVSADNKNRPQKLGYNADREPNYRAVGKYWGQWQCLYNGEPFE